ncbi:MAG: SseB family protein [Micrococcaceae bacterium]|nr:SseB family protein [Micrococcaceae bacterium]
MHTPAIPPDVAAPPPAGRAAKKQFRPNPFAGDDGSCPPPLATALAAPERTVAVVAALSEVRLLLPVLPHAHPGRTADGGVVDHESIKKHEDPAESACAAAVLVSVELADGRRALPVFSSLDAMAKWNPQARPVPVEAPRAALAAVSELDGVMLLDPESAHATLVPRPAAWALTQGRAWIPAARDKELAGLIARTLTGILPIAGVRVEAGVNTEIRIVLALRPGLDASELKNTLTEASNRLRADDDVRLRVESMELYPTALAS